MIWKKYTGYLEIITFFGGCGAKEMCGKESALPRNHARVQYHCFSRVQWVCIWSTWASQNLQASNVSSNKTWWELVLVTSWNEPMLVNLLNSSYVKITSAFLPSSFHMWKLQLKCKINTPSHPAVISWATTWLGWHLSASLREPLGDVTTAPLLFPKQTGNICSHYWERHAVWKITVGLWISSLMFVW